jgi:hypothetical protein
MILISYCNVAINVLELKFLVIVLKKIFKYLFIEFSNFF